MSKPEEVFDKRVLDLYMREGIVSEAEYTKFIKALPDSQKNAELVNLEDIAPASYLRSALGFEKEPRE